MKVIVTGAAGFIGYHLAKTLLKEGHDVVGIDNLSPYYDVNLKKNRIKDLEHPNFTFILCDISKQDEVKAVMKAHSDTNKIVHLAAQAGVRYSIENPQAYLEANILGQLNLIEEGRKLDNLDHFLYASTSSVYGSNDKLPFSVQDRVDHPISFYAVTKRSCELMADYYHDLYKMPLTGFRFFTVYGPWGRPDMAAFLFTDAIYAGRPIKVFNNGQMGRNFTYIDDIIAGLMGAMGTSYSGQHKLYNLGNNRSEKLMDFIHTIEDIIGKKAEYQMEPMQAGDVKETIADISETQQDFGFEPKTDIQVGLKNFIDWYKTYYSL